MISEERQREIYAAAFGAFKKKCREMIERDDGLGVSGAFSTAKGEMEKEMWVDDCGSVMLTVSPDIDVDEELSALVNKAVHLINLLTVTEGSFDYYETIGRIDLRLALPLDDSVFDSAFIEKQMKKMQYKAEFFYDLFERIARREIQIEAVAEKAEELVEEYRQELKRNSQAVVYRDKLFGNLCDALDDAEFSYSVLVDRKRIIFTPSGSDGVCVLVSVNDNGVINFRAVLPLSTDEEMRYELERAIVMLNKTMKVGSFALAADGESLIYNVPLPMDGVLIGKETFRRVVEIVGEEMAEKGEDICKLCNGELSFADFRFNHQFDLYDEYCSYSHDDDDDDD